MLRPCVNCRWHALVHPVSHAIFVVAVDLSVAATISDESNDDLYNLGYPFSIDI